MEDIEKQGKEEEEEKLLMEGGGGMAVLDFDLLCSTVAMQTHGKWTKLDSFVDDGDGGDVESGDFGGVFRMWEGELLDCFDNRCIALQTFCCPCYRFGKNMRRAGFGYCFLQGTIYFALTVVVLLSGVAYIVTKQNCFLYIVLAFIILVATYLGYFRTRIRKKFNIKGSDSSFDDCVFHLLCSCCTLSQESRTLEMNNVQDGIWHGRGDTICIGTSNEQNKPFVGFNTLEMNNVQDGIWHGRGDTVCIETSNEQNKSFVELNPPPLVSTKSP